MSCAIIRNAKYKAANVQSVSRHNERQNKNYGNKDINADLSELNYHLKKPQEKSYEKEFYRLREENNLKGNLRLTGKKQSSIVCEFLITSDNNFFNYLGNAGAREYFEAAYEFACQKCGEKNIISAVVHMDETTPHMHLTYIPVVKGKSKKGEEIEKINCSEFWSGFNSYGKLQDDYHAFIIQKGFNLERGEIKENPSEHLSISEFKIKTAEEKAEQIIRSAKRTISAKIQEVEEKEKQTEARCSEMLSKTLSKESELEYSIKALSEEKDALEKLIDAYKGMLDTFGEIDSIGKQGILGKISMTVEEVINLKTQAKAYITEKAKSEQAIKEVYRLNQTVQRMQPLEDELIKLRKQTREIENELRAIKDVFKSNPKLQEAYKNAAMELLQQIREQQATMKTQKVKKEFER